MGCFYGKHDTRQHEIGALDGINMQPRGLLNGTEMNAMIVI